jgi:DNA helicase HerA-like ATPase
MAEDREIGRAVAVDTSQLTIELGPDVKALTRSTYEQTYEVGRINSYVLVPVGARVVVAMVTRVVLAEEAEIRTDRTMVVLPSARRLMKATMVGTIDDKHFTQGVNVFPVLDSPVLLVGRRDLQAIFGHSDRAGPGYCIPIGRSAVFPEFDVRIDPDAFFGKHAAVIGSTGSGKSCTIAAVIQAILDQKAVKNTRFIILDTNGEYREAFQKRDDSGAWKDVSEARRALYIPTDPERATDRLVIPYWFMDSSDLARMFRAREGLQAPVLLKALALSREGRVGSAGESAALLGVMGAMNKIQGYCDTAAPNQQYHIPGNIQDVCGDFGQMRTTLPHLWAQLEQLDVTQALSDGFAKISDLAGSKGTTLGPSRLSQIHEQLQAMRQAVYEASAAQSPHPGGAACSPDAPAYFDIDKLARSAIDLAMKEQAETGSVARVREACGPMMLRIHRYLSDPRFEFLFGRHESAPHVLAAFIRDILGMPSAPEPAASEVQNTPTRIPFYERQRKPVEAPYDVVIVDLSLLAAEVLENVTALIGRLILEFLQRMAETSVSTAGRGALPVVLVLEEAQNYIPETRGSDDEMISKRVFERIAREGRKHGLGLVVASQRPCELSRTVMAQCSSFLVHRLQNPEDLRYFREVVPGIYRDLLDQLPALPQRVALALGECVPAPALVEIREAAPTPRSRDPRFYESWTTEDPPAVDVEAVCAKWEGTVTTGREA